MTSIGYVIQISRSYQNVKDDDVFDQFLPSIMYLNRNFFQTKGQIFIILIYFDNGVMTIILLNLIKFELYNSFLETVAWLQIFVLKDNLQASFYIILQKKLP